MGGLLTDSSVLMCPHGGTVQVVTSDSRVQAASGFVLRSSDTFTIVGCPLNVSGAPHPCATVNWVVPSLRSKAVGDSTLTDASVGLCQAADQAVQGPVQIVVAQPRVTGQ
jgi:hypothetical protein